METFNTFAERLKYARQRAKMSQEELARRVNVSKATISKAEMGLTQDMMMNTLFAMADAMMIDPRWLATGKSPITDSAVGLPGSVGLNEAFGKLPSDLREPLMQLIDAAATAAEQRYWKWIAEWDKR